MPATTFAPGGHPTLFEFLVDIGFLEPGQGILEAFPQTILEIVAQRGIRCEGDVRVPPGLVPEILFHLAGQVHGLVIQPIHELLVSELSSKGRKVLVAQGKRLGGIGYARGTKSQVVVGESPLQAQAQALQIRDDQRV
jgi:hypothetical protein